MSGVELLWFEFAAAAHAGLLRAVSSIEHERRDRVNDKPWIDQLHAHVLGAAGELALCKERGWYWDASVGKFHAPDIGELEIRTRSRHSWDLPVRPHEPIEWRYALITGTPPSLRVVGWIDGCDARRTEWWADHGDHGRPAWFVPAAALRRFQ